jgi:uncharacterized membrane protein
MLGDLSPPTDTENKIRQLTNEQLLRMVHHDYAQYNQEEIQYAWTEIERRGLLLQNMSSTSATEPDYVDGSPSRVWKWYVAYCGLMALMYLGLLVLGIVFMAVDPGELEANPDEAKLMGAMFAILGLIFFAPYAAAPFLPKRPWVWILGLVLICLGMTSACCLPAAIPLLIFWLKPDNRRFFNKPLE